MANIPMNLFRRIWNLFYEGFRGMTVGKRLWTIILVKLCILFFILRLIFFPNFLNDRFKTDKERSDYVREQLIKRK